MHRSPDDHRVAELLRAHRPEATAPELDDVKRRVQARASRGRRRTGRGTLMKSRFAMMAMLVVGLLMSGTGAGLAVSGISDSGSAGIAQYGTVPPPRAEEPDAGDVLPTTTTGGPVECDANGDGVISPAEALAEGCAGVAGEIDEGGPVPAPTEDTSQPARQLESGADDSLPFTGFAAIPILLGGVALVVAGLVLRRRSALDS